MKKVNIEKNKEKYLEFIGTRKNLILSSLDEQGHPFISCAPFVQKDGKFYIYISMVAEHYKYITETPLIDAAMFADESAVPNTFATERARFRCKAENIGNEGQDEIFEAFNERFDPKMLTLLRGLDFSLFELKPVEGRYVVGFGMAFDVDSTGDVFKHVVVDKENKPGA